MYHESRVTLCLKAVNTLCCCYLLPSPRIQLFPRIAPTLLFPPTSHSPFPHSFFQEAVFATLTNVNFDAAAIKGFLMETVAHRDALK